MQVNPVGQDRIDWDLDYIEERALQGAITTTLFTHGF